ncbi:hypothetical protein [Paenibacillus aquistagni]|uniref:hypothetical protein n=1 Tax=Paenibacillus aquistagni TaxID=1852522 RepID=UPI000B512298|nr:hypothetical protein [Paenibacillus aquistagni]
MQEINMMNEPVVHTTRDQDEKAQKQSPQFTKEQFLRSARYSGAEKDVLSVILQEDETYRLEQIEEQFTQFIMREVQ